MRRVKVREMWEEEVKEVRVNQRMGSRRIEGRKSRGTEGK